MPVIRNSMSMMSGTPADIFQGNRELLGATEPDKRPTTGTLQGTYAEPRVLPAPAYTAPAYTAPAQVPAYTAPAYTAPAYTAPAQVPQQPVYTATKAVKRPADNFIRLLKPASTDLLGMQYYMKHNGVHSLRGYRPVRGRSDAELQAEADLAVKSAEIAARRAARAARGAAPAGAPAAAPAPAAVVETVVPVNRTVLPIVAKELAVNALNATRTVDNSLAAVEGTRARGIPSRNPPSSRLQLNQADQVEILQNRGMGGVAANSINSY